MISLFEMIVIEFSLQSHVFNISMTYSKKVKQETKMILVRLYGRGRYYLIVSIAIGVISDLVPATLFACYLERTLMFFVLIDTCPMSAKNEAVRIGCCVWWPVDGHIWLV